MMPVDGLSLRVGWVFITSLARLHVHASGLFLFLMAKDPRFNFYVDNWIGGCEGFTLEQEGAYLALCLMQTKIGRFTKEQALDKLMQKTRGNTAVCTKLIHFLIPKFETDGTFFWSERMEKELSKSKNHSLKQTERINKRWGNDSGNTAVLPDNRNGSGNGINIKESDFFDSNAQAYMILSGNYHDTDAAKKVVANNGWPAVSDADVKALIHHFIETQVDVKKQERADIRSHLRRWLNKQPVDKMREWSKNILENHARRGQKPIQGQNAEIPGATNGVQDTG